MAKTFNARLKSTSSDCTNIKGYSYIELMVTIMIMAILFSVGVTNYRGFQRRQALDAAVRQVRSDLSLAREYALAGRVQCPSGGDYLGHRFIVSGSQYIIQSVCDNGSEYYTEAKTESVPTGYTLTGSDVRFNAIGEGTDAPAGGEDFTISLTESSDPSFTRTVTVTTAGDIQ